ncbi:MAG TPA: tetratricopeptide repeat protein [Dongiaceae bacterium]|jgi:Tfp pilus assembly protein PilF|nr:tetratricopeptide repeat protein [Dongiaceae bacterium]
MAWCLLIGLLVVTGCAAAPEQKDVVATAPTVSSDDLLTAAEADIEARRFQLAYQRLTRLDQAALATPRAKLVAGEVFLGLTDPKQALAQFESIQSDATYGARAYQGMGLSLVALGDFSVAQPQLDRAVAADPTLWRSWMALGRVHDASKNWTDAQAAYEKALAAKPDSAIVINNMGMSLMMQHRYAEAVQKFQSALAIDPAMEMTRANLRIALAWQGQYDEALVGIHAGGRADALNNVGYVAMLRGDQKAAQQYFSQALEISPTYHERAAGNLEMLKLLAKSKATNQAGLATDSAPAN